MDIEKGFILFARIFVAAFVLVALVIVGAYWWSNVPPSRPKGLSTSAQWLWGPPTGLPGPKRGIWISCWIDNQDGKSQCKTSDKDGRTLYQGVFRPYNDGRTIPHDELAIDLERTQSYRIGLGLFIQGELVPLVYLKNGDILIPAAKYEEGKRSLDARQQLH